MDGVLNLIKAPGMTSHDMVTVVRRVLQTKKVGHTGTLDPGVAGVLPICVGKATRLAEYITGADKAYRAEITFGLCTDSQDSFGQVIGEMDGSHLTSGDLAYMLTRFQGEIMQVPPMISAVKVGGKRLYELARAGITVERPARPTLIHRLQLLDFRPGIHPVAYLDVVCAKGTYIRTLAADIGDKLGIGAHMSYLVRTRSGAFGLETANTLEELAAGEATMLSPVAALGQMPQLTVVPEMAARIKHGVMPKLYADGPPGTVLALLDQSGELVALAETATNGLKLLKVFA